MYTGSKNRKVRLSTGRYEPEDDWPGTFIRGDDSMGFAGMLRSVADLIERTTWPPEERIIVLGRPRRLRELADILYQCKVPGAHPFDP